MIKHKPDANVIKFLNYIKNTSSVEDINFNISKENFINQIFPDEEVVDDGNNHFFSHIENLDSILLKSCSKILGANECTNALRYHPQTIMKWHTNSDNPGTRLYYTYTEGEAIFKYIDENGVIKEDYDNIGEWTVREFTIPKKGVLWHTIWTDKTRYSFGFNIKNDN